MKLLVFVIIAAAAAYYFLFHDPSSFNKITSKVGLSKSGGVSAKYSGNPNQKIKFKEDSLGDRLTTLSEDKEYDFPVNMKGQISLGELRSALANSGSILNTARSLVRYKEFGITQSAGPNSSLDYMSALQPTYKVLAASAIVLAADGKTQEAIKDFERIVSIYRTYLSDRSLGLFDLFNIHRCFSKDLVQAINTSRLSSNDKKSCLRLRPGRKDYAAALSGILENEYVFTQHLISEDKKGKPVLRNKLKYHNYQTYSGTPSVKLESLLKAALKQISGDFADGSLTANTAIKVGTAQENKMLTELLPVHAIGKISDSLR